MTKSYNKKTVLVSSLAVLALSGMLTGCNRSINDISPEPLASAPVTPVTNNSLPPIGTANSSQVGVNPNANSVGAPTGLGVQQAAQNQAPVTPQVAQSNTATQVASNQVSAPSAPSTPSAPQAAAPKPSGKPVTREAVSGTWVVASDNPNCRMILAFTKWQGGYRAASRKCSSAELGAISAWDVSGKQVVLKDSGGNTVARLFNSGGERYDGTTNSGAPISLSRS
ncbi:MAG: AprI/Inh family metalloprotease inhibitor [Nitratireductor sp.]